MRRLERDVALQIVDTQWKDHLYSLDHLKEGIGLRGYGQRDPLVEYKKESFALFQDMRGRVEEEIVRWLFGLRPVIEDEVVKPMVAAPQRRATPLTLNQPAGRLDPGVRRGEVEVGRSRHRSGRHRSRRASAVTTLVKTVRREEPKVGRNDPCPCGSGKKYKKCHGMAA